MHCQVCFDCSLSYLFWLQMHAGAAQVAHEAVSQNDASPRPGTHMQHAPVRQRRKWGEGAGCLGLRLVQVPPSCLARVAAGVPAAEASQVNAAVTWVLPNLICSIHTKLSNATIRHQLSHCIADVMCGMQREASSPSR